MDKVKAFVNWAADAAKWGWDWVGARAYGPLVGSVLFLVLVLISTYAHAQGQYPALIDMEKDVYPVYTQNPQVIVFCEENSGADNVHLCQAWGMPAPGMIIPVSPAVYCFIAAEKEVIHEGNPDIQRQWGCGNNRAEVAEAAKKVGKEVKTWGRPIRQGELAT